jgi:hypothetical protein
MRAKFIKDALNERFSEESDPIIDMGIGSFASLKKGDIIECKKFVQTSYNGKHDSKILYNTPRKTLLANRFFPGQRYLLLFDAIIRDNNKIEIIAINVKYGNGSVGITATPRQLANRFKIIK